MAIGYLLVTFPEQRAVLAGGNSVGFTDHTFMLPLLPTDKYMITLEGTGYQPPSMDIVLSGTSVTKPLVITFTLTSAAAPPPSPPSAAPSARTARRGAGK